MFKRIIGLLIIVCYATVLPAADIKKWVDSNGKVHYGEKPPAGLKADTIDNGVSVIDREEANPVAALYSTSRCGYCKKAKAFMRANNIQYREYNIERNSSAKQRYNKMGAKAVPFLVLGEETLQGFSKTSYRRFFGLSS